MSKRERPSSHSHVEWSVEEALRRGLLVEVEAELCEWARLPVTVRLSQAVDEQIIPTLEQEEEGEDADNRCFDVLWAAREAIEAADPWDNQATFVVTVGGHTLELCVVIDTTYGRALHIEHVRRHSDDSHSGR
jgi:hypothetical protein